MTYRCPACDAEFVKPHVQEHTDLIAYGSCVSSEVTCVTDHCPECGCEDFEEVQTPDEVD